MFVALSERRQVRESKDMSVKAKKCQGKHIHVSERSVKAKTCQRKYIYIKEGKLEIAKSFQGNKIIISGKAQ
jgi:hypothetical protein